MIMAMASLNTSSDIRNSLLNQLSSLSGTSFPSESQRVQVKDALTSALARIQTPWETAFSIVFTQVGLNDHLDDQSTKFATDSPSLH